MTKLAYEFDPFKRFGVEDKIDPDDIEKAREDIADFVKEMVLSKIGDGESPVRNGQWTRGLTTGYKKIKGEISSNNFANLELSGELVDSLDVRSKGDTRLVLDVGSDQEGKDEGNIKGTYGRATSTGRRSQ